VGVSLSDGGLRISGAAVEGVRTVALERADDGLNFTRLDSRTDGQGNLLDDQAEPAASYQYRLVYTLDTGEVVTTEPARVIAPPLPAVPEGFTGTALSPWSVRFAWNCASMGQDTGYILEISPDGVEYESMIESEEPSCFHLEEAFPFSGAAFFGCVSSMPWGNPSPRKCCVSTSYVSRTKTTPRAEGSPWIGRPVSSGRLCRERAATRFRLLMNRTKRPSLSGARRRFRVRSGSTVCPLGIRSRDRRCPRWAIGSSTGACEPMAVPGPIGARYERSHWPLPAQPASQAIQCWVGPRLLLGWRCPGRSGIASSSRWTRRAISWRTERPKCRERRTRCSPSCGHPAVLLAVRAERLDAQNRTEEEGAWTAWCPFWTDDAPPRGLTPCGGLP